MNFLINLLGEFDYIGENLGRVLGLIIFHTFMLSITGGLWLFWLVYKYMSYRRNRNNWMR